MENVNPVLIVMLTKNDHTVKNAHDIFEECRYTNATHWGFKEEGIPHDEMKKLFTYMKSCKKTTVLEVVAYSEEECIKGAQTAVECDCDILMGTLFFDSVKEICLQHGIKYMPFAGNVTDRPSVLNGTAEEIVADAQHSILNGACGIDLLGYRYTGNPFVLNSLLINSINAPVCLAGSIDSYEKLDEIKALRPWAFTIGSAFFDCKFGNNFSEQIQTVIDYIEK